MFDALEMLADNVQAARRQQRVNVRHAADQRIFARQHADRLARPLITASIVASKVRARQRRAVRKSGAAGHVAVGAGPALEGDGSAHGVCLVVLAGAGEILGRVHAERRVIHARHADDHAGLQAPAVVRVFRAVPAGWAAARRSAPGRRGGRRRCRYGARADPSPAGTAAREKYSARATSFAPVRKRTDRLDHRGRSGFLGGGDGRRQGRDIAGGVGQRVQDGAQKWAGGRPGRSPCRLITTSCSPARIDPRQRRMHAVRSAGQAGVGHLRAAAGSAHRVRNRRVPAGHGDRADIGLFGAPQHMHDHRHAADQRQRLARQARGRQARGNNYDGIHGIGGMVAEGTG